MIYNPTVETELNTLADFSNAVYCTSYCRCIKSDNDDASDDIPRENGIVPDADAAHSST